MKLIILLNLVMGLLSFTETIKNNLQTKIVFFDKECDIETFLQDIIFAINKAHTYEEDVYFRYIQNNLHNIAVFDGEVGIKLMMAIERKFGNASYGSPCIFNINYQNKDKDTLLMVALRNKNFELSSYLLDQHDISVEIVNNHGMNALDVARKMLLNCDVKKSAVLFKVFNKTKEAIIMAKKAEKELSDKIRLFKQKNFTIKLILCFSTKILNKSTCNDNCDGILPSLNDSDKYSSTNKIFINNFLNNSDKSNTFTSINLINVPIDESKQSCKKSYIDTNFETKKDSVKNEKKINIFRWFSCSSICCKKSKKTKK